MNKLFTLLSIACILAVQVTHADVAGFEVGAYQWTPDYKGTLSSDSISTIGTSIDIQDDLGFSDDSHNIIWVALEHPIPFLPNIKIVSSDLATSASATLNRDIIFDGQTYSASEDTATNFDLSNTEFTFYYEILDNWINIDLGVTLRKYDGQVQLTTAATGSNLNEMAAIDFTIPLIYAAVRFDLPLTGFFVAGDMNFISYQDDSVSDRAVTIGYESDYGLGAKVGYRAFSLEVMEDSFSSDLDFEGAYISVFYHF